MGTKLDIGRGALASVVAVLVAATTGAAQEATGGRVVPTNEVVLSGYGTVGYGYRTQGEKVNAFSAAVNPIFLFQFQDRVLFEAELEFELEEGITETGLEYAQLDVILHDNVALVGGKFLLPFGVFGERLHPSWINKFSTAPPIYGHHIAAFGAEPLLPILSDVGIMGRAVVTPGPLQLALSGYVTQGPGIEEVHDEGPAEDGHAEEGHGEEVPELRFFASSSDNNKNKMFGGRLDIGLPPRAEINLSFLNGKYDEHDVLDFTAWNVAAELRLAGFELRGEYVQTRQEIETHAGFPTVRRDGFYAQLSHRHAAWEPLVRWTQVFATKLDGMERETGAWQAGLGLDYWINPSISIMAGFELNREQGVELQNDRFVVHIAYGF